MQRVPNGKTVIVLLEVAGQAYGLPVTVVQDALKVCRSGQAAAWRPCSDTSGDGCDPQTIEVDGRQIPLVDLRTCLGLSRPTACPRTRMAIVVRSGEHWLGLLVDAVGEIAEVPRTAITVVPRASTEPSDRPVPWHQAIAQVARLGDRTIGLLDADRLLPAPASHLTAVR
jgi:chemotaxis signal transduction protein